MTARALAEAINDYNHRTYPVPAPRLTVDEIERIVQESEKQHVLRMNQPRITSEQARQQFIRVQRDSEEKEQ